MNNYLKYYNEAFSYYSQSNYKNAIPLFKKTISLNPKYAPAYNQLGNIYKSIFNLKYAEKYYKGALRLLPGSAVILSNLGSTYNLMGNIKQAKRCFQKAVRSDPNFPNSHYSLAKIYLDEKSWRKGIFYCKKTIDIDPNFGLAYSLLAFSEMQICDWNNPLDYNPMFDNPILSILRTEDQEINSRVANHWSNLIENKITSFPKFNHQTSHKSKKITIGYVSNDFYPHATISLISGLFRNHNKKNYNINIYSYGRDNDNNYIREFKKSVSLFRDISNISDFEAAQKIYSDDVDILIDLKGYTGGSRMEIFSFRPAPVQITWLGFPGTTGSNFIDYILTDKIVTPKSTQKYFDEKFVYLPNTYQINNDKREISNITLKRLDLGLGNNCFIFCSFSRPEKITPNTFESWIKILKAVPSSTLWLLKDNDLMENNLRTEAVRRGVEAKRLVFAEPIEYSRHLKRHSLANLCLDTFIYNGHTTSSDSLWVDVPVVTLLGKHFASRVSASLLTAIGLPELITKSQKEYESLAINLATNPSKLSKIKQKLQKNKKIYPLFNTKLFTINLEKAYSQIWENYSSGNKPKEIVVK